MRRVDQDATGPKHHQHAHRPSRCFRDVEAAARTLALRRATLRPGRLCVGPCHGARGSRALRRLRRAERHHDDGEPSAESRRELASPQAPGSASDECDCRVRMTVSGWTSGRGGSRPSTAPAAPRLYALWSGPRRPPQHLWTVTKAGVVAATGRAGGAGRSPPASPAAHRRGCPTMVAWKSLCSVQTPGASAAWRGRCRAQSR